MSANEKCPFCGINRYHNSPHSEWGNYTCGTSQHASGVVQQSTICSELCKEREARKRSEADLLEEKEQSGIYYAKLCDLLDRALRGWAVYRISYKSSRTTIRTIEEELQIRAEYSQLTNKTNE